MVGDGRVDDDDGFGGIGLGYDNNYYNNCLIFILGGEVGFWFWFCREGGLVVD